MKILVTGGLGYLGRVLMPLAAEAGHSVAVADMGLYEGCRNAEAVDIRGIESLPDDAELVVHLAAIVGEPACKAFPRLARSVNFDATINMLKLCERMKIPMIFASTCSVYGACDQVIFENHRKNPLGIYARDRLEAERHVVQTVGVALRFGTLFGWSPRMRFDLVINKWAAEAHRGMPICVDGGQQWRPFCHVRDAARSILTMIEAVNDGNLSLIQGEAFNVSTQNVTIVELANVMRQETGCEVEIAHNVSDMRDYRVSTNKIELAGWEPKMTVRDGIREILAELKNQPQIDPADPIYSNLEYLKARQKRVPKAML